LALVISSSLNLFALEPIPSSNQQTNKFRLSTNPLSFIFGYEVSAEYSINENLILNFSLGIIDTEIHGLTTTGKEIDVGVRFFFKNYHTDSWYFYFYWANGNVKVEDKESGVYNPVGSYDNKIEADINGFAIMPGYQWFYDNGWFINFGLGLAKLNIDIKYNSYDLSKDDLLYQDITPKGEFRIGYQF
jgi:hypothetical protein